MSRVSHRALAVHIQRTVQDVFTEVSNVHGWTQWTNITSVVPHATAPGAFTVTHPNGEAAVRPQFDRPHGVLDITWEEHGVTWAVAGRVVPAAGDEATEGCVFTRQLVKPANVSEELFRTVVEMQDADMERLQKHMEKGRATTSAPNNGVVAYLTCTNAVQAIEFYKKVFHAQEKMRQTTPAGKIVHCQLRLNCGDLMLADDFPEMREDKKPQTPTAYGGSPVTLHVTVADVDETVKAAVELGATVTQSPNDAFWGDRFAKFTDPSGHGWSVAHPRKAVTQHDLDSAVKKSFGEPDTKVQKSE